MRSHSELRYAGLKCFAKQIECRCVRPRKSRGLSFGRNRTGALGTKAVGRKFRIVNALNRFFTKRHGNHSKLTILYYFISFRNLKTLKITTFRSVDFLFVFRSKEGSTCSFEFCISRFSTSVDLKTGVSLL